MLIKIPLLIAMHFRAGSDPVPTVQKETIIDNGKSTDRSHKTLHPAASSNQTINQILNNFPHKKINTSIIFDRKSEQGQNSNTSDSPPENALALSTKKKVNLPPIKIIDEKNNLKNDLQNISHNKKITPRFFHFQQDSKNNPKPIEDPQRSSGGLQTRQVEVSFIGSENKKNSDLQKSSLQRNTTNEEYSEISTIKRNRFMRLMNTSLGSKMARTHSFFARICDVSAPVLYVCSGVSGASSLVMNGLIPLLDDPHVKNGLALGAGLAAILTGVFVKAGNYASKKSKTFQEDYLNLRTQQIANKQ